MADLQSAAESPQGSTPIGGCVEPTPALTRRLHTTADPDLARVVAAWPALPPHLSAAVLALVATVAPGVAPEATGDRSTAGSSPSASEAP